MHRIMNFHRSGYGFLPTEFCDSFVRQQMLRYLESSELMYEKQVAQYLFGKVVFQSVLLL